MQAEKEETTGLAAAQNPAYKSIEELGGSMALQAAIATRGARKKKQDQIEEETIEKLGAIEKNGTNLAEILEQLPVKNAESISSSTTDVVQYTITSVVNYTVNATLLLLRWRRSYSSINMFKRN